MIIQSPAKINLNLHVGNVLPTGLHEIASIMQTVSLSDELEFELLEQKTENTANAEGTEKSYIQLLTSGADLGAPEENLVYRAAKIWLEEAKVQANLRIHLIKRIPHAAGLGGGSSNAAATLKAMQELFPGKALDKKTLQKLAFHLGSDVTYFLFGGTCLVEDSGDKVTPLAEMAPTPALLVSPRIAVSTKEAFALLDKRRAEAGTSLSHGNNFALHWPLQLSEFSRHFTNDFRAVISESYPIIEEIINELYALGASYSHLSGSGPSLFALFENAAKRDAAAHVLQSKYPDMRQYCVETITKI